MTSVLLRLLIAVVLAGLSGFFAFQFSVALVVKSIDNPLVSGSVSVVHLTQNPVGFWFAVVLHAALAGLTGYSAYKICKSL